MIRQQQALMETEGVQMEFTDAAIREIAKVAEEVRLVLQCESGSFLLVLRGRSYCAESASP